MQQLMVNFKPGYIPPKRKTIANDNIIEQVLEYDSNLFKKY